MRLEKNNTAYSKCILVVLSGGEVKWTQVVVPIGAATIPNIYFARAYINVSKSWILPLISCWSFDPSIMFTFYPGLVAPSMSIPSLVFTLIM
jgi:hypothetical protein